MPADNVPPHCTYTPPINASYSTCLVVLYARCPSFSPGCHENILMYLSVNPRAIVMEAMSSDLQALLIDKRKLTAVPRTQRMRYKKNL